MLKIDLHTHSQASPDGSLTAKHYMRMLMSHSLDYIAITDHNTIDFANELHKKVGDAIIIGEEIDTSEGEMIGLYLHTHIPPGQSAAETARAIHQQGGLVYIPHPFETVRKGLQLKTLNAIADLVDIIEIKNGRALFQNRSQAALGWAKEYHVPGAASSDAHGWNGWGNTYSYIATNPTVGTLCALLTETTRYARGNVGFLGALYPKLNRLRKIKL